MNQKRRNRENLAPDDPLAGCDTVTVLEPGADHRPSGSNQPNGPQPGNGPTGDGVETTDPPAPPATVEDEDGAVTQPGPAIDEPPSDPSADGGSEPAPEAAPVESGSPDLAS